jgi:hypothetical protein
MGGTVEHQDDDAAVRALDDLHSQLERTIAELRAAGERIEQLARLRAAGHSWFDIVSNEERPLVVETITRALDDLGAVGGRFRREEALALQQEDISINRISQLFGVSRQRISALVRHRNTAAPRQERSTAAG